MNMSETFTVKNSFFYPVQARSQAVDQFQHLVEMELVKLKQSEMEIQHSCHSNLSNKQRLALKELSELEDVVIHKADKGRLIAVPDKCLYLKENFAMLMDSNTYQRLSSYPTHKFEQELRRLVTKGLHLGVLSKKQAEYIVPDCPHIPIFYSLPNIHKGGFPPAFRPNVLRISSLN